MLAGAREKPIAADTTPERRREQGGAEERSRPTVRHAPCDFNQNPFTDEERRDGGPTHLSAPNLMFTCELCGTSRVVDESSFTGLFSV